MAAIASCYLCLSGLRCLGFFTLLHRARGHVVSKVILKHFPAGVIPYRAHFELKLLADQRLLNICLSASIAQVGARDNLPNTNRYKFCCRCWDGEWRHTWRAFVFEYKSTVYWWAGFTNLPVWSNPNEWASRFHIRYEAYPEQWVKGRYVCETLEPMFILFAYEQKKRKIKREKCGWLLFL